jgi:hypothetical protein
VRPSHGLCQPEPVNVGVLLAVVLLLTGCASQPPTPASGPGFLLALWHGFIAPLALVGVLLHWLGPATVVGAYFGEVRIYAWPNSGPFYDLGFVIGLSAWAGGAAVSTSPGDYEHPDDELQEAQDRVRRLRRRLRRLKAANWQLRNRGQS